ncbi:FecR family protein [Persicobacter psychrovividus]|uniref:FecR family protein n=1 Tax=Persicobacter psychrovividus TaxID=387638 RepID=A0ABM7VM09_9BACT|nr:hypothetical protein PEPS_42810 [Persicobacter psychrovividus]
MDLRERPDLLINFYTGKCSYEEYLMVMEWLSDPVNEAAADRIMKDHWALISGIAMDTGYDQEGVLNKIKAVQAEEVKAEGNEQSEISVSEPAAKVVKMSPKWWYAVAASLIFIFISIGVVQFISPDQIQTLAVTTHRGEQRTIVLPDSSVVTLNVNSELTFPEEFETPERIVYLKGEAFFKVNANPKRPFIVKAGGLDVTAHGTEFNVNFSDKNKVIVGLMEGKVLVKDGFDQQINMKPNDKIAYSDKTQKFTTSNIDELTDAWRNNILVINQLPFKQAVEKIADWYNVDIEIKGKPSTKWLVRASFKGNDITKSLESLSFLYGIRYHKNKDKIIIEI